MANVPPNDPNVDAPAIVPALKEEEDPEEDLEEDPEEEPEDDDDDDMEMDDEAEVIDPYMDDGSNNPPPPNSKDEETSPTSPVIPDADGQPIHPIASFGQNFHFGESSSTENLLIGNSKIVLTGPMCPNLGTVWKRLGKMEKFMSERIDTEGRIKKKFKEQDRHFLGLGCDNIEMDMTVRNVMSDLSRLKKLVKGLSNQFDEYERSKVFKAKRVLEKELVNERNGKEFYREFSEYMCRMLQNRQKFKGSFPLPLGSQVREPPAEPFARPVPAPYPDDPYVVTRDAAIADAAIATSKLPRCQNSRSRRIGDNIPNNQNGWIEEEPEKEEEDPKEDPKEDDDDIEMDDEAEVIDPYMDDGSNNTPPSNSKDKETPPTSHVIPDADGQPIPPIASFGQNFHFSESSSTANLLTGNSKIVPTGPMCPNLGTAWKRTVRNMMSNLSGLKKLVKGLSDRFNKYEESKVFKDKRALEKETMPPRKSTRGNPPPPLTQDTVNRMIQESVEAAIRAERERVQNEANQVVTRKMWAEMKVMMTEEFCPLEEIQRMESELWNLRVKEMDISSYTTRFNKLVILCPGMVPTERKKVEAYICGLSENIKGEVTSSEPATLSKAVWMAHTLMKQKVKAKAEREADNKKRKWENFQGGSSGGGNNNSNRNNNNYNNNHVAKSSKVRRKSTRGNPPPPLTQDTVNRMIQESVEAAIQAERERVQNEANRAEGPNIAPVARECTFANFMKCSPITFHGNEGDVCLIKWIEKTEMVFTVATSRIEAVTRKTWVEMKVIMTEEFCPPEEIQRMKGELWNLRVKEMDISSYTTRFNELVILCSGMVPTK
nr:hypothetical protein [Tanacetum cinerariifolium]